MTLINTRNNNYGIPMVIGIATDGDAENALKGGRDWIDIGDTSVEIGDYYYDNQIVGVANTTLYDSVIAPVIFAAEEPDRIERDRITAENDAALIAEMESEEWQEWAKSTDGYNAPEEIDFEPPANPPDPGDEEAIQRAVEETGTTDPRKLPPPVPVEETYDFPTQVNENEYNDYLEKYQNISALSVGLAGTSYTVVNDVVIFPDPGLEFPDGVVQKYFPFPDDDIADYKAYVTAMKGRIKEILDYICDYLGKDRVA